MAFLSKVISFVANRTTRSIEYTLENAAEVNEKKLLSILKANQDTIYGREHGFDEISSADDFADRVPISTFKTMKPYLEEVYKKPDGKILTTDPVVWYVQTSGSTGHPKTLPVTKRGMKEWSKGSTATQMTFISSEPENSQIFEGNIIMFGAPAETGEHYGLPVGYMTGIAPKLGANFLFRRMIKPGPEVFNLTDMEEKMRQYALYTARLNVTVFAGITTLSLAFFRRMQSLYGPWLLDIFKNTKHEERIKESMDSEGNLDIAQLWPSLRQLVVTGIDTDPYREWISKTLPNTKPWEAYAGSEGYYGCQVYPDKGVFLLPETNYFEFIPEDEIDSPTPTVLPLADVKKNKRYEILITNAAGWYRYRIGDMLTFDDVDPYIVKNIGRRGRVVNLTGEKVSDAHITEAISRASQKTHCEVLDYAVVGLVEEGVPHYAVAAMFRDDEIDSVEFIGAFEEALCSANREFGFGRNMGALGPSRLFRMTTSHSEAIVEMSHIQAKPRTLTTDRSVLATCEAY
jgi:hypothetical protein